MEITAAVLLYAVRALNHAAGSAKVAMNHSWKTGRKLEQGKFLSAHAIVLERNDKLGQYLLDKYLRRRGLAEISHSIVLFRDVSCLILFSVTLQKERKSILTNM